MVTMKERFHFNRWNRRDFLKAGLALGGLALSGSLLYRNLEKPIKSSRPLKGPNAQVATFIGKSVSYNSGITANLVSGFKELGVKPGEIKGKRVLLKPNLVETHIGASHINTHPLVVRGAIEAFLSLGAASVIVAEGPGHSRDSLLVLEESGMGEILQSEKVPFFDLNYAHGYGTPNVTRLSHLSQLTFPVLLREVDWVVSMPKMKTHHWAGVTLSLKNLFGVMPGSFYGWPKNVLHWAGIDQCIIDINATLRPQFAIVDGIVGMEGDGPIMGMPKHAGVMVMGRNLTSVDATCVRIMGINPEKVNYLRLASIGLGPIKESQIPQRGERIEAVRTAFALLDHIPVQKQLKGA
ncbi:MAG: DUF362 domain-containing protein [Pseudomonadota bacterium]